jgi:hypothetical protein
MSRFTFLQTANGVKYALMLAFKKVSDHFRKI